MRRPQSNVCDNFRVSPFLFARIFFYGLMERRYRRKLEKIDRKLQS